jgi:hypothetical protein
MKERRVLGLDVAVNNIQEQLNKSSKKEGVKKYDKATRHKLLRERKKNKYVRTNV